MSHEKKKEGPISGKGPLSARKEKGPVRGIRVGCNVLHRKKGGSILSFHQEERGRGISELAP